MKGQGSSQDGAQCSRRLQKTLVVHGAEGGRGRGRGVAKFDYSHSAKFPFNASRTHSCKHLQGCGSSSALIATTTGTRVTIKHRQEFFITSAGGEKIPISSLCRTLAVGQSGACVADNRVFVKGEVVAWLQVSQLCSKLLTVETSAWLAAVLPSALALLTHGIQFVTLVVLPRPKFTGYSLK